LALLNHFTRPVAMVLPSAYPMANMFIFILGLPAAVNWHLSLLCNF